MRNIKACLSCKSDEWATPSRLYKRYMDSGYFDPCPLNHNFDGLQINWKSKNFVNPPFSKVELWVKKAIQECDRGNKIVMLLPVRTDTQWCKLLFLNFNAQFTFIEGRFKFNDSKFSAPFPCMFVTLDKEFNRLNTIPINYITRNELERFIEGN